MKKKRKFSVVHLKRDISRTLNHFSESSDVITIYESEGWVIERFDNDSKLNNSLSGVVVYDSGDYKLNKEDTEYIISILSKMTEYKKHIEALVSAVKDYEETVEKDVRVNYFFDIEEMEALSTINEKIQQFYNQKYSGRYLKQLYTTMKNYLKFPKIYEKDFYENLKPKKKKTLQRYYFKTRFHFYYYQKYYSVNVWQEGVGVIENAKKLFKESEEYIIWIFEIFEHQYYVDSMDYSTPLETENEIKRFLSRKHHIENEKITIKNKIFDLEYIIEMYKDLQKSVSVEVQERALYFNRNKEMWKRKYNIDVEANKPLTAREIRIVSMDYDFWNEEL